MHRRRQGFSLTEIMVVVAIMGVAAALTVPAWQRLQTNGRAKGTARLIANAFQLARTQAVMTETNHVVMWSAVSGNDACGHALPAPIVVLVDNNPQNCCIDAPETVYNASPNPAQEFAGLNWGVTFATLAVPEDTGGGAHATGSSFSDQFGAQTHWVNFRNDGVPVGFTTACTLGQVGTGGGGVYLTNGGAPTPGERDYAVVLSPLGAPKVYSWSGAAWTN